MHVTIKPRHIQKNKMHVIYKSIVNNFTCYQTFKLLSSFPARASSNVDFPEPGGPNNKVILSKKKAKYSNLLLFVTIHILSYNLNSLLIYLPGLIIPLISFKIVSLCFRGLIILKLLKQRCNNRERSTIRNKR